MIFPSRLWGSVRVLSGVAIFASKNDCSNPCSFRDMTVFMIFSEFFKKKIDVKTSKSLKISILLLESVRVLSWGCKSCSEYVCSKSCRSRDMTVFRILSEFFRELGYKFFFIKLEITISPVRLFQGSLRVCDFCLQIWLLKTLQLSRYDLFVIFFNL